MTWPRRSRADDTARPQLDADGRSRAIRTASARVSARRPSSCTRSTMLAPLNATEVWKRVCDVITRPASFHTVTTGVSAPRVVTKP